MPKTKQAAPKRAAPQIVQAARETGEQDAGPPEKVELKIPARAEYVRVARLAAAAVAGRLGFGFDEVESIKLAIGEACNNAILHARPARISDAGHAIPVVTIVIEPHPDRIEISVSDEGRVPGKRLKSPAAAVQLADSAGPDGQPSDLPEGGLGLLLIRNLMDELSHHSGHDANTTVRMTKYLRRPAYKSHADHAAQPKSPAQSPARRR